VAPCALVAEAAATNSGKLNFVDGGGSNKRPCGGGDKFLSMALVVSSLALVVVVTEISLATLVALAALFPCGGDGGNLPSGGGGSVAVAECALVIA